MRVKWDDDNLEFVLRLSNEMDLPALIEALRIAQFHTKSIGYANIFNEMRVDLQNAQQQLKYRQNSTGNSQS